ncbi:putative CDP-glycerol:poly(Glycerophosphate) glycerophosphotransferase [Escherichia coli]|uniref:Putative CDP-glycerol:poly(Glycerophosphate) glycerophosphotransferase n=1 Tax=Escherichia coli TaxID=562 RepID=A0A376D8S0_ECOLX|nr:putative CDP-glycerol:poly(Glycerophosphate) glycerophosphotransferase [Escherichia coli]
MIIHLKVHLGVYDMQYAIIADPPRISNLLSRAYHKVNNDKNSIKKTKKTFLYAPTWRDDRSDFISISGLNFNEINNFLLKNKRVFTNQVAS